jgi:hypothetical protein
MPRLSLDRYRSISSGPDFEKAFGEDLRLLFPMSALSSVCLFRADGLDDQSRTDGFHGYELDHLIEVRSGADQRIVVFECKNVEVRIGTHGPLSPQAREWKTGDGRSLKAQARNEIEALRQNLATRLGEEPWIDVFVVCRTVDNGTKYLKDTQFSDISKGFQIHLVTYDEVLRWLSDSPKQFGDTLNFTESWSVARVSQSHWLRLIRQGMVVADLGHPELANAVDYVSRCRETLDNRLWRQFEPTKQRWAINGSAGMGKSYLLAYAMAVIASDRQIAHDASRRMATLSAFDASQLSMPLLSQRRILVFALKPKQKEIIERAWQKIRQRFDDLNPNEHVPFARIDFAIWKNVIPAGYNVLLIDEAHDLTPDAQKTIAGWLNQPETTRYLVIACDRYQKLRLVNREADMLLGVSFVGCSKRLRINYRNPVSVYMASLALLFRWCAITGPTVVPTREQLVEAFGFEVLGLHRQPGSQVRLRIHNDYHPGNHWCHTVGTFPSAEEAHSWLGSYSLHKEHVLWASFLNDETADMGELADSYFYIDLSGPNSATQIDREIKGREFSVVVIEGLPADFSAQADADRMWQARRLIYLCASRANAFLFFVCNYTQADESIRVSYDEVIQTINKCATPSDPYKASTKDWLFDFSFPFVSEPISVFNDDPKPAVAEDPVVVNASSQTLVEALVAQSAAAPAIETLNVGSLPEGGTEAFPVFDKTIKVARPESVLPQKSEAKEVNLSGILTESARIDEKEFQRRFSGFYRETWRSHWAAYRQTGALPFLPEQSGSADSLRKSVRKPDKSGRLPVYTRGLSVRQLAAYLNVKPFRVVAAAAKTGSHVYVDGALGATTVVAICKEFHCPPPIW